MKNKLPEKPQFTFKDGFYAALGFYVGQGVASLIGLGVIGLLITIAYYVLR